jgi:glycine cleavage system regulatory protein
VSLVLTVIGPDRPGLVELLARTVAEHEANWLESRMSHLEGQFAGLLRVSVASDRTAALSKALAELEALGLRVMTRTSEGPSLPPSHRSLRLELVGQDRPGIIRDLSRALAARRVNVEELLTSCSSAPMSGEVLFEAKADLRIPRDVSLDELRETLETIANELMVDLTLDDPE